LPAEAAAMVRVPAVEVVMVMLEPAARLPTVQELPLAMSSWPLLAGAVEMPVPPELMPKTWERVRLVMVVVARVEVPVVIRGPETVKAEVEALVTVKLLVAELKVKLEEVAKVLVPAPNRMSLAVKFCSWMVGVVPPEDRTEPEPETEVT